MRMHRLAPALLLLAGLASVAASAPLPGGEAIDAQLRQARDEAKQADAEQARLEKAASDARDSVTRLRARQLAAAQAIESAEAQITAADTEARMVQARLSKQQELLAARQAPVSRLLAGLVLAARRPPLLLLAGSGSAEDLVKLRLLVSATAPAIRARTAELARALASEQALQQQILTARNRTMSTRDELRRRRQAFAALEQRAAQVASARGVEAMGAGDVALATEQRLTTVEESAGSAAASRRLASELAALGPAPLVPNAPAAKPALKYLLPSEAPVTDGMGAISSSGVRSRGITLATRRGAALAAPASGTILFAGSFRDYDGVIIINHGDGWKSVLVNAGTRLPKGTTVQIGEPLGVALGPVQVQLQHGGEAVSPALIARSSAMLSNGSKGG
jgi:septal ring factor EnvC (AmiA/AmiB activator)